MKLRHIAIILSLALPTFGFAQEKNVETATPQGLVYALPSTTIQLTVKAELEVFHAGDYAKFAQKYLGIEVPQKNSSTCKVVSVKMKSLVEADQGARYAIAGNSDKIEDLFLKLSTCGLVSLVDSHSDASMSWRFPGSKKGGNVVDGIVSNIFSDASTLYKKGEGAEQKVSVQQNIMKAKTVEQKAAETAQLIFDLRAKKMQIITGDTDATYSGEAMAAALEEIGRLEEDYLKMFTGWTETATQILTFDVIPENGNTKYVAFRISDSAGLLPPEDMSGRPVLLELTPQEFAAPQGEAAVKVSKKTILINYRTPAICSVKLTDGKTLLLQGRTPVYQMGQTQQMAVGRK